MVTTTLCFIIHQFHSKLRTVAPTSPESSVVMAEVKEASNDGYDPEWLKVSLQLKLTTISYLFR